MLTTHYSDKHLFDHEVEGYILLLDEQFENNANIKKIEDEFYPRLTSILKRHEFFGKSGDAFVLTANVGGRLKQFFFIGIGPKKGPWHHEIEQLRRAVGTAVKQMKKLKVESAAIVVPAQERYGLEAAELLKQAMVAAHLASYEFVTFKTDRKHKTLECDLHIAISGESKTDAGQKAAHEAHIIGRAINHTRHLNDMPGNVVTPTFLAEEAGRIAKDCGMKLTVLGRKDAEKLGMGGFLAVDAGSEQDGKFIILDYQVDKNAPTIALIGKGVTFDTGGVTLKPRGYMGGMKHDMSGAGAVLGAMRVIGELKPKHVNVVAITPAVENMPSGSSSREDDIVTFLNGKTAEIKSTDAEGRLILADALSYAEKYFEPDVMLDAATLTGACVTALGHYYTGMMTKDDKLAEVLFAHGLKSGDKVWRLPFDDDYNGANRSDVADVSNAGSRAFGGGSIEAGKFLENFVEKTPWVHLDIAGSADGTSGVSYYGKGATGAAVRLFVDFVMNYQK